MNKVAVVFFVIIAVIFGFYLFPSFQESVTDVRTDEQTDAFTVSTGAGVTNGTVTLSQELWLDATSSIESLTSDLGTDNPVAGTYTVATRNLNVTGLTENTSRNLSIAYEYAALSDFEGMDSIASFSPFLLMIALILLPVFAIWWMFKNRGA